MLKILLILAILFIVFLWIAHKAKPLTQEEENVYNQSLNNEQYD